MTTDDEDDDPHVDLGGLHRGARIIRVKPAPHRCNHPDGHICPWADDTDPAGRAIPCGCWTTTTEA